jgi:hypothetical protein
MNYNQNLFAVLVTAVSVSAFLLGGCAARPPIKLVYAQEQFESRLAYLRFCQRYELLTYRCES